MKIAAVCPTYKRPRLLGRAIHCFLQQTYKDCELVVLDDAGQYKSQKHERWRLVSVPSRFDCLAAKRQAAIEMVSPDVEGIVCWDDDDVYFPHAIECVATSLKRSPWSQCQLVYETTAPRVLAITRAMGAKRCLQVGDQWLNSWGYGGCWAYRLKEFHELKGYSDLAPSACEDIDLAKKFYLRYGGSADSTIDGEPWYWYNRDPGISKIAKEGIDYWRKREGWEYQQMNAPPIGWNGPDVCGFHVLNGIHPRPF